MVRAFQAHRVGALPVATNIGVFIPTPSTHIPRGCIAVTIVVCIPDEISYKNPVDRTCIGVYISKFIKICDMLVLWAIWPNIEGYKVCVVLPRAPCRGVFPDPRGPPSGTCLWQPAFFVDRAPPSTSRAGDRHRAFLPAVQRIAVASRPGVRRQDLRQRGILLPSGHPGPREKWLSLRPPIHQMEMSALPLDTHRSGRSAALNRRGGSTAMMVMKTTRRRQKTTMPERDKRKRSAPISYRPPKAMREEFARRVAASGMNANAFITQSIFERDPPRQARRASVNTAEIARLIGECARLRDRLEAIEASAGEDMEARIAEAILQLTEIRTACFMALGRESRSANGDGLPPSPERRPS